MNILFISRKNLNGYGGLSRFAAQLTAQFGANCLVITPNSWINLLKLLFIRIDHIHLCDATLLPIGIICKFFLNKPMTVTAHGLDITWPNPVYQFVLKKLLPCTSAVIVDTKASKKLLKPFRLRIPVFVISPGIAIDHLTKIRPIPLPDLSGAIVLTTVGHVVARKGQRWFVEKVIPGLPHAYIYLIVGKGPEQKTIKQTVSRLHLEKQVVLLGPLTDQQLAYILKITDIYICPNQKVTGDYEGFGIAAGEASAMGLPVIASDIDGIPAVIQHKSNGLLVHPDPQSFTASLHKLKYSWVRKKLGKQAAMYTRRTFRWKDTAKKYLHVFKKISQ